MEIKTEGIIEAWLRGLYEIRNQDGVVPTQRKNTHTKEVLNVQMIISDPMKDLDVIPDIEKERGFDLNSVSNELYWDVMVGQKLKKFKSGDKSIDQINTICQRLEVKYNRQAYATVWSPEEDTQSFHPVCILGVYFYIRQERLHMVGILRSNDAWGQGLNDIYHLVKIQQEVAERLKIKVGSYTHNVMSLHVYETDIKAVDTFFKIENGREDKKEDENGYKNTIEPYIRKFRNSVCGNHARFNE